MTSILDDEPGIIPDFARQFDRLPPHSIDDERCLIGSMLLERSMIPVVRGIVGRESFYQVDHQVIFDVLCDVYDAGKPVDSIIVRGELRSRQLLDEVGGTAYLGELLHCVPSAIHAKAYAERIAQDYAWRQLIGLSNDLLRTAYAPHKLDATPADYAQELASKLSRIGCASTATMTHTLSEVIADILKPQQPDSLTRIPTGLFTADDVIGGLRRGGKTIVGGKPGMGKSALLKQVSRNVAGTGVPCGVVTVEESCRKWGENLLANESGVANNRIAFGRIIPGERRRIEDAGVKLSTLPIYLVDAARKLTEVIAAVHRLVHEYGCQVVCVDHLHIIDGSVGEENREREISRISAALKALWKDLNIAGVEAAQLNRKSGRDRPGLDSLRDSGSLEADGDTIILLHREDYYGRADPSYVPDNILEFIVAKNKDGATATVPLNFEESRQRISDLVYDSPI